MTGHEKVLLYASVSPFCLLPYPSMVSRKEMIKHAAEVEMRHMQIEKEQETTRLAEAAKREEDR